MATLANIRTGLHETFDRVVLDMTGAEPGVITRLVDELFQDGSGAVVWLTGCAFVAVRVEPGVAHDDAGQPTYPGPLKFRTPALNNVMAVALTSDFEGVLGVGIGIRRATSVNAFTLSEPTRVVVDVTH